LLELKLNELTRMKVQLEAVKRLRGRVDRGRFERLTRDLLMGCK
jgi:hypothetical protein